MTESNGSRLPEASKRQRKGRAYPLFASTNSRRSRRPQSVPIMSVSAFVRSLRMEGAGEQPFPEDGRSGRPPAARRGHACRSEQSQSGRARYQHRPVPVEGSILSRRIDGCAWRRDDCRGRTGHDDEERGRSSPRRGRLMEFFPGAFEREWERRRAALLHEHQLGQTPRVDWDWRRRGGAAAWRPGRSEALAAGARLRREPGVAVARRGERPAARCARASRRWRGAASRRWSSSPPMAAAAASAP